MKSEVFFPIYSIHSDLVKTSLGLTDNRSIEKFFREAGIKVHEIGKKKCVMCQDLLNLITEKPVIMSYKPQSNHSQEIFDMFE